jgi:hypothetical protein
VPEKHVEEMTMPEVMKAVLKKDKYFFADMGLGEEKAIVLNDGMTVVVCKEKEANENGLVGISISRLRSIRIDTTLIMGDYEYENKDQFQLLSPQIF